jgi:hypothetical protein
MSTDPDIVTDADIADRPTVYGKPYTEDDLMTAEEWWDEFRANICCVNYTQECPCGGNTDVLPSNASRLLEDDSNEPDWEAIARARRGEY